MAPLIVLVVVTLAARLVGALGVAYVDDWPEAVALGLAAMFLLTASAHVVPRRRAGLIAIVPPALPRPALLVTITGSLELLGAAGLTLPGTRAAAAACLALLLVAMFPANVYAAGGQRHPDAPATPLVPRLGMQIVFLVAAGWVAVAAA